VVKKVMFAIGLCSIIFLAIYYSQNNGKVMDVYDFTTIENERVLIRESFNGKEVAVESSATELSNTLMILSDIKYNNIDEDDGFEITPYKYSIYLDNQSDMPDIILDTYGICFPNENNLRYKLKKEDIEMVVSHLQNLVDNSQIADNTVCKSDYVYLYDTHATDLSVKELLSKLNVDINHLIVKAFSLSVTRDGKIEAFTFNFYDKDQIMNLNIRYNRLEENLKISEIHNISDKELEQTDNLLILNSIDELLKQLDDMDDQSYLRLIEMYAPYSSTVEGDDKVIYYNGLPTEEKQVSGQVFTVYDINHSNDKSIEYYVFGS
jgi:hypothetical protein